MSCKIGQLTLCAFILVTYIEESGHSLPQDGCQTCCLRNRAAAAPSPTAPPPSPVMGPALLASAVSFHHGELPQPLHAAGAMGTVLAAGYCSWGAALEQEWLLAAVKAAVPAGQAAVGAVEAQLVVMRWPHPCVLES
eukprot:255713-Pelagomonas_calceolata.AAC.2